MLRLERQAKILQLVQEKGFLETPDLAELFSVSVITVRRDLKALVDQHLVALHHGGVAAVDYFHSEIEPLYETKAYINAERKELVARRAASLISDGETIVLDAGTTTANLASAIRRIGFKHLRVFTNDLIVAKTLCTSRNLEVVMMGGLLRSSYYSAYGPLTEMCLKSLRANKLFLGIDAATISGGISNLQLEEVPVKQRMIEICDEVIVISDSSKLGSDAPYRVCEWPAVSAVVTDLELDSEYVEFFQSSGITLHQADGKIDESSNGRSGSVESRSAF